MKENDLSLNKKSMVISVPIIKKKFVDKNWNIGDKDEFYIRRSKQDYYIKFCESNVSEAEIENVLSKKKSLIPALTLEVEFKHGNWDNCIEKQKKSNRKGEYVVVLALME